MATNRFSQAERRNTRPAMRADSDEVAAHSGHIQGADDRLTEAVKAAFELHPDLAIFPVHPPDHPNPSKRKTPDINSPSWKDPAAWLTADGVSERVRAGGYVGWIPCSAGLVGIDVDVGDKKDFKDGEGTRLAALARDAIGFDPDMQLHGSRGDPDLGCHLYFASRDGVGNDNWYVPVEGKHRLGGELRGAKGYLVIYDWDGWAEFFTNGDAKRAAKSTPRMDAALLKAKLSKPEGRPRSATRPGRETKREPLKKVQAALSHIPSSPPGEGTYQSVWFPVACALKSEFGEAGYELLQQWDKRFSSEAKRRRQWDAISADGGIGIGSLYKLAKGHGWHPKHQQGNGKDAVNQKPNAETAPASSAGNDSESEKKLTEVEAAKLFHENMRTRWLYDSRKKMWRRLRHGRLWVEDSEGARRTAVQILIDERPDSRGMQRRHSIINALAIASDENDMHSYQWDTCADLCCPGGIINCTDGTWHPGAEDPSGRHTRVTPVDPDMEATATLWDSFLHDVTGGNTSLIRDLQRFVGNTLTADTNAEQFYVLIGPPSTGKTTFIKTVEYILGDYTRTVSAERLTGRYQAHRQWMAGLDGARLVICTEPPPAGAVWKSGELSSFVSGETQEANFMRANSFNFQPISKLWIAANDIPRASGPNSGVLRRIVPIPFNIKVPKDRKDKGLFQKLKEEAPAILGWAVKGLADYRKHGMGALSQNVRDQQDQYAAAQDDVRRWITESGDVETDPQGIISKKLTHELYERWCSTEGLTALAFRTFNTRMKQLPGIGESSPRIDNKRVRSWTGLREVKPLDERNPPPQG